MHKSFKGSQNIYYNEDKLEEHLNKKVDISDIVFCTKSLNIKKLFSIYIAMHLFYYGVSETGSGLL